MIDLSWDTSGRLDKASYNKERWRHFAFCLIPVVLFVLGGVAVKHLPIALTIIAWIAGFVLLSYYRYRFVQVMIRRLHDRNLSGKLLLIAPASTLLILAIGAPVLATNPALDTTWVPILALLLFAPFIGFNIFLRYQISRDGTANINRYGPPPGTGQALIF